MRVISIIMLFAIGLVAPIFAMDENGDTEMDIEADSITENLQQINLNELPRRLIRQNAFYYNPNDMSDEDDTEELDKHAEI